MTRQIVGRQAEIAEGERVLDAARYGRAVLVLQGDAGVGKTSIWERILASASARGFRVLVARPVEAEARLSFAGLTDLLAEATTDVLAALPPPQARALSGALLRDGPTHEATDLRTLGTAVYSAIRRLAADDPVVVAIDDLQWLDEASFRVLAFAFRRLRTERVALIATTRTGADDRTVALTEPVGTAALVVELNVPPMTMAGIHHLVLERFGFALPRPMLARLHTASGGNALLAVEILAALQRRGGPIRSGDRIPVPLDVRRLVAERVAALPPEVGRVLLAASAMSHPRLETIAAVSPGTDVVEAVAMAEEAGICHVEDDGSLRFEHPLYSSAIYTAAAGARRMAIHRALAGLASDPEERARHLALGGSPPDATTAAALETAAMRAAARGAPSTAAELMELAITWQPPDDRTSSARAALVGHWLWEAGDVARSRALIERIVDRTEVPLERAAAQLMLAVHALWSEGAEAAIARCVAALRDAGEDPAMRARIHLRAAYCADHDLRLGLAHARAAVALAEATEADDPDVVAAGLLMRAELYLLAEERLETHDIERGSALISALSVPPIGQLGFDARAVARERAWLLMVYLDDLVAARSSLRQLMTEGREAGRDRATAIALSDLSELSLLLGEVEAARSEADEAVEVAEQTGPTPMAMAIARLARARVSAHDGDLEVARSVARQLLDDADALGPPLTVLAHALLGSISLASGDGRDGSHLTRARLLLDGAGTRFVGAYRVRADEIEALVMAGELGTARDLLGVLERGARLTPTPWTVVMAARCRALVAAASGETAAALDAVDEALRLHPALPIPLEFGRSLLLKGRQHRRRREKRRASDALLEAASIFERLGAQAWLQQARAELARIGLRPPAPHGLTATEERVAELAAGGLTNRQVADALVLSPKTIDGALTRVYEKLGIHSRAELGALMAERRAGGPRTSAFKEG